MRLFESIAVVTNGATGVGFTLAAGLVRDGASVTITDFDADRARDAAGILQTGGSDLQHSAAVAMNSADAASVDAAARAVLAESGAIDILVTVIRDSLDDVLFPARAFLPAMRAAGRGKIINVLCESDGAAGRPHKPDVVALTQRLAGELDGNGVGVNCLCLGPTLSKHLQIPAGPYTAGNVRPHPGAARRIGVIIAFLAGSASDYMNGEVLNLHEGACKAA